MFSLWKNKNKNLDIKVLIKKAQEGDNASQLQLGLAYYRGTNVKKNIDKAQEWLTKAGYSMPSI
jgi:TPR repeat protein